MSPIDELTPILKKLRLSDVLNSLELRVRQTVEDDVHPAEFLLRVLHDEIERREGKQLEQRLRRASFETQQESFELAAAVSSSYSEGRCVGPAARHKKGSKAKHYAH